jgi:hypothetical protein
MKNFITLFIFMLCLQTFGQVRQREVIRGQIFNAEREVESITVFNKSSNKGAVTDELGFFTIMARPKDTLVFSSVAFSSRIMELTETDFRLKVIKIELISFINELDEVIITPNSLSGDLVKDNKNLKVTYLKSDIDVSDAQRMMVENDGYSSPENPAIYDGSIKYGMDFIAIGKMVGKAVFGEKEKKPKGVGHQEKIVAEIIKEKFTYHFFHETLGLKNEEIGLFLNFCESDSKIKTLLVPNKEIELIDFLIEKNKEFKKL